MIPSDRKLIIGTRGSELALWQANFVKQQLADNGVTAELKIIKTQGDRILNLSFDKLEGKGFFTKELEEELMAGKIDLAVHSHKDLPTEHPPGLTIAAVSEREDPSELLLILKDCVDVRQKLSVKFGGMVGTSSNRRKAQLLALRPDLEVTDLRGNVPTRINKLRSENYDAIMLAKAGVHRLGIDLSEFHVEELKPTEFIPAPAQGALAIQIREIDTDLFNFLQQHLHSKKVAEELTIERNVLKMFGGGCHMPLGCYCQKQGDEYQVFTSKADSGEELPDRLFTTGTSIDKLPEQIVNYFKPGRKFPQKVFISRDISAHSYFRRVLEKHGIEIEDRSLIRTVPIMTILNPHILKEVDWVFFTSKNAVEYFFQLKPQFVTTPKFGVIGSGSEDMLRRNGYFADFVGDNTDTAIVGREFSKLCDGCTVLFPGAESPMRSIQKGLTPDTKIIDLPVYETMQEEQVAGSCAEVLVFTSPSNVVAYFEHHLLENYQQIVAIGKSTGKKLDELNMTYKLPFSPDEIGLAEAVFGLNIGL